MLYKSYFMLNHIQKNLARWLFSMYHEHITGPENNLDNCLSRVDLLNFNKVYGLALKMPTT